MGLKPPLCIEEGSQVRDVLFYWLFPTEGRWLRLRGSDWLVPAHMVYHLCLPLLSSLDMRSGSALS